MTRRDLFRRAAGALSLPVLDPVRALAAEVKRVRITDIESFQVRVPGGNADDPMKNFAYGVSRVHTDAGVTGTAFLPCPGDILRRWVKPTLVGQDLFAIDRHVNRLQALRGESGVQIWSGVEHAMWDVVGKIANLPVRTVKKLVG